MDLISELDRMILQNEGEGKALRALRDSVQPWLQAVETLRGLANGKATSGNALVTDVPSKPMKSAVKAAAKAAAKAAVVSENKVPLRQVVFSVLGRAKYKKEGLRAGQIVEIIENEGLWHTDHNLSSMVSSTIHGFKRDGKVKRGQDKRYILAAGAKL